MTPDTLIDRLRLKRRLNIWRIVAVLALVLAAILAAGTRNRRDGAFVFGPHIERYRITGLIGDGNDTIKDLDRLAKDSSVSAVMLHLDTPGGAVSGGEGIHDAVIQLASRKPVVAVMDGTAASAGYMIAVAAPHIVARASTITGSIGVIMETANFGGLLDKVGINLDPLVSGPLKGQPSFDKPLTPEARQVLQGMVGDLYDQFVGIVSTGRHMDTARVRTLADGRAYTGRQALQLGLIDEIGGEREARVWMEKNRGITANLPITEPDKRTLWERWTASSLSTLVFGALGQAVRVDGAWAVWQP